MCTPRPACTATGNECDSKPLTPVCKTPENICVECLGDGNCGGSTPVCDTVSNTCVECTQTSQCGTGETCTNNKCVTGGGTNVCGDGNPGGTGEQCDDGNLVSGDGCSGGTSGIDVNACKIETLNVVALKYPSLTVFGFEDDTTPNQGWSTGADSNRATTPVSNTKSLDNGQDGGSWVFHIQRNSASSITLQNFNLEGFKEITIRWQGYYDFSGSNDCLEFKIDNNKVSSWGNSGCDNNGITMDSWLPQEVTFTNAQYTFDNTVELKFEGEMSSAGDDFYIDGISITGKKY